MKICVYGGQFGSEGKGSIAEVLLKAKRRPEVKLIVFGDNSPNSGHTNSLGKTRNLPVSSFYADIIILGPDAVIDLDCLVDDIKAVQHYRFNAGIHSPFQIYIHESAALTDAGDKSMELQVVSRISSTGSGSGAARFRKQFHREGAATIGGRLRDLAGFLADYPVSLVNNKLYFQLINSCEEHDCLFECSQGTLLDVNFGYYPHVTSRSTLARVAVERNGLGDIHWDFAGVYRTYPIRTGGPSGPTGAPEIGFEKLGVTPEIATVTRRTRRIFEFSLPDFLLSIRLNRPDYIAFTHLDYVDLDPERINAFIGWLGLPEFAEDLVKQVTWVLSNKTGKGVVHE